VPDSGFDIWNGSVQYSRTVLESIRAQAVEGLTALSHGGLEVGGVLYGERQNGRVRVLNAIPLECEHARGPGFLLSHRDTVRFRELLSRPDCTSVGWYCSHTRSELALNCNDTAIMQEFFPGGGALALIVKPMKTGPAEATFFLQDDPVPGPHFSILPPRRKPRPDSIGAVVQPAEPPPAPAPVEAEPDSSLLPVLMPAVSMSVPPRSMVLSLWRRRALAGALVLLMAIASIALVAGRKVQTANRVFGLQAYPLQSSQIRIEWDRQSPAVRAARSATLVIADGTVEHVLTLDADQLRKSTFTYDTRSPSVKVSMKLAKGPEESVLVISSEPPLAPKATVLSGDVHPPAGAPDPVVQIVGRAGSPAPADPRPQGSAERQRAPTPPVKPFDWRPQAGPPNPTMADLSLLDPPPGGAPAMPATVVARLPMSTVVPVAPAAKPNPAARSGRLIWTGQLDRKGVIEIEGSSTTVGSLTGTLPGISVNLRIMPAKFDRDVLLVFSNDASLRDKTEPPGPLNGWNRLRFVWNPDEVARLSVLEQPRGDNQFSRLVLRNEGRPCEVILVDWRGN